MQAKFIQEPELEFGAGRHIDIRFGIMRHGVLDADEPTRARQFRLGIVGSSESTEKLLEWLESCGSGVESKTSNKPNLFPHFPGFGNDSPFRSSWTCDSRMQRSISANDIARLASEGNASQIIESAVRLYVKEISFLADEVGVDVILCVVPNSLLQILQEAEDRTFETKDSDDPDALIEKESHRVNFHHWLKAEAMKHRVPIQIVLPSTFGMGKRGKATRSKRRTKKARQLQDEATRAWNIFTALYYKAGGTPWRLCRDTTDYTSCYVGISFYKSLDEKSVMTSIAQVFNERGEGIVVRGGQARISKTDRTPHLSEDDSAKILVDALTRYRQEHKTVPARVVIHKSSYFSDEELTGFQSAVEQERVEYADLISIRRAGIRLFRTAAYPVLRGTYLELDASKQILYTRGSVPFFETYPGLYAPRALEVRTEHTDQSGLALCREILALTKMNWNNTQFDNRDPITLRAADEVGDILKYLPIEEDVSIAPRYSFYM
jgi:hypothetical protein